MVLGLIGMGHVFGGPVHISGSVHGHVQSTIAHISGKAYSGVEAPMVKNHVSGAKKLLPVQEPEPVQPKAKGKAKNIGITLGPPEKSISTQVRKKNTGKTKTNTRNFKIIDQASLKDRVKQRKACWKACENIWIVNFQEQCFALPDSLQQYCKKKLFKGRLACVSQNCRAITQ